MTHSNYEAREQARWMKPNAALWVRPDAARFYRPGTRMEDVFPALALKYNPNQPRVPSGNPDGGQWTDGEGGSGRPRVIIDTTNWSREGTTPEGNGDEAASGDHRPYDTRLASNEDKPALSRNSRVAISGRSIDIYVDRPFCNSCKRVVPLVGLELGKPEITIIDPQRVSSIANGRIISQRPR